MDNLTPIYQLPMIPMSEPQKKSKPFGRPAGKNGSLPRYQRASEDTRPGFARTARDEAIIKAVAIYRALNTEQIERLFFAPTTKENCRARLRLLFRYHYLYRAEQLHTTTNNK